MGALAEVLAKLAVAILEWWAAREDLRKSVRATDALAAAKAARMALEWKLSAVDAPGGGAELRVRDNAPKIQLSSEDSNPSGRATVRRMHSGGEGN